MRLTQNACVHNAVPLDAFLPGWAKDADSGPPAAGGDATAAAAARTQRLLSRRLSHLRNASAELQFSSTTFPTASRFGALAYGCSGADYWAKIALEYPAGACLARQNAFIAASIAALNYSARYEELLSAPREDRVAGEETRDRFNGMTYGELLRSDCQKYGRRGLAGTQRRTAADAAAAARRPSPAPAAGPGECRPPSSLLTGERGPALIPLAGDPPCCCCASVIACTRRSSGSSSPYAAASGCVRRSRLVACWRHRVQQRKRHRRRRRKQRTAQRRRKHIAFTGQGGAHTGGRRVRPERL